MAHVLSLERRQRRVRRVVKAGMSRWTVKVSADLLDTGGQPCLHAGCVVTIEAGNEIDGRLIIAKALRAEAEELEREAAKGVPSDAAR